VLSLRDGDRADLAWQLLADQQECRDDEARQVWVAVRQPDPELPPCTMTVSAPVNYGLKQLTVMMAGLGGGMTLLTRAAVSGLQEGRRSWAYSGPGGETLTAP